jgi:hypothetical protein
LAASCASSESAEPDEPFTSKWRASPRNEPGDTLELVIERPGVLTEWVSEQEVRDLLEELADEYGGEVADEYHAVVEPLPPTERWTYLYNPGEGTGDARNGAPDPDVDVDADMLTMEVRTGRDLQMERRDAETGDSFWNESDRLPEGAEFRILPFYGYAFRGADSDEYVDVYVWRDWDRSHGESGEYEAVHLTAGAMVLREMNWAD